MNKNREPQHLQHSLGRHFFFTVDLSPDAYATIIMSGHAAGLRDNGTVGV